MGSVGRARAWEGGVLQQPRGSGSRQGSPRGARGRGRPPAAVLRAGHSVGDVLPRASSPAPLQKRPCPCLWGAGRDPQTPRPLEPPAVQDAAVRARVRSQCLDLYGRKGGSASGPCRGPGGRRRPGPGTPGEDAGFQTEWECLAAVHEQRAGLGPLSARGQVPGPRCHAVQPGEAAPPPPQPQPAGGPRAPSMRVAGCHRGRSSWAAVSLETTGPAPHRPWTACMDPVFGDLLQEKWCQEQGCLATLWIYFKVAVSE